MGSFFTTPRLQHLCKARCCMEALSLFGFVPLPGCLLIPLCTGLSSYWDTHFHCLMGSDILHWTNAIHTFPYPPPHMDILRCWSGPSTLLCLCLCSSPSATHRTLSCLAPPNGFGQDFFRKGTESRNCKRKAFSNFNTVLEDIEYSLKLIEAFYI